MLDYLLRVILPFKFKEIFLNTFLWTRYSCDKSLSALVWCLTPHQSPSGSRSGIIVSNCTVEERTQVQDIKEKFDFILLHDPGQILRWSSTRSLAEVQNRWFLRQFPPFLAILLCRLCEILCRDETVECRARDTRTEEEVRNVGDIRSNTKVHM